VRGLEPAFDEAAFAEEVLLDAVGRDEDVRGLGLELVLDGTEEAEALLSDFEVAGAYLRGRVLRLLGRLPLLLRLLLLLLLILIPMLLALLILSWSAHMGVWCGDRILKRGNYTSA